MKRKLRFTIRATLLVMTLTAVLFAVFLGRIRARRAALHTVALAGGSAGTFETSEPVWLRSLFNDDDYFREMNRVSLGPNAVNSDPARPAGDAELCTVIESLPHPDTLTSLNLSQSLVSDDGLSCLQSLSNLERLNLRNTLVTDAGLQRIAHCNQLRSLDLAGTTISDRGLPALAWLNQLEQLDLDSTRVTESGLKHLAALKTLRRLDLDGTQFLGGGLMFLARLPNMEELILDGTEFGSRGAATVYLQRYAEKFLRLRVLSLENTPVTNLDLPHLQGFPVLEKLILDGTGVTDDGLSYLGEMTTLKEVSLKKTGVTKAGIVKLQSLLPACSVSGE